jgi:hypothetical protein
MKRIDTFEFEDLSWFPQVIREGGTDYLRYFLNATRFYDVTIPLLHELSQKTGSTQLLDLCSGGGGGFQSMIERLEKINSPLKITLTDKFPNISAFDHLVKNGRERIGYEKSPVDALAVPADLPGILTMYSATHHFSAKMLGDIIRNAASQHRAIAFFDGGDKSWLTILGLLVFQPLSFLLCTPFFRPFHWRRLFFTYLLPLIPLMTLWDGIASVMRLYTAAELLAIARKAAPDYEWKSGYVRNRVGMKVVFLCGSPG